MPIEGLTPGPANPQPLSFSAAPNTPAVDLCDLLPPGAAEKLRTLRQRSEDLHAVIPDFEAVRTASMARIEAQNALARLTAHSQDGGFGQPLTALSVVQATATLAKATAEFERLRERQAARSTVWQEATQALAKVQDWLKSGRPQGVVLEDVDTQVKLAKGEANWSEAVENRRAARERSRRIYTGSEARRIPVRGPGSECARNRGAGRHRSPINVAAG